MLRIPNLARNANEEIDALVKPRIDLAVRRDDLGYLSTTSILSKLLFMRVFEVRLYPDMRRLRVSNHRSSARHIKDRAETPWLCIK